LLNSILPKIRKKPVARAYSERRKRDLLIAKITTKNGKRRVLKYQKQKH